MVTLSIAMIVKNEEEVLQRCLESIKDVADEIIIVDTGSTDKTIEIAKKYTKNIYNFEWIYDFAKARNYAFSKATKDYTMWLDADDILEEKNKNALKELKKNLDNSVDMVIMKYNVSFDENNNPTFSYNRERIVKTSKKYMWVGEIHEVIPQYGNIIFSDIAISHKKIKSSETNRNLEIFNKIISKGKELDPRQKYYYARELYYNKKYLKAIKEFDEFLQEGKGFIENNIEACKDLALCYYKLEDKVKALNSLFRSFIYDEPRAEVCCSIGKHFFEDKNYKLAIFWYNLASIKQKDIYSGGFVEVDCYDYIPYMQLSLCYYNLKNFEKANYYNEKAGKIKPTDKSYLYNKKFYSDL